MHWSLWPQYTVLALMSLAVLVAPMLHGKPSRPHNGFTTIADQAISLLILWFGGFFDGLLK